MSNVVIDRIKLDALANTISAKSGESIPLTLAEMADAVENISGGGAVVVVDEQLPGGGTAKHITAVDISDTTAVASDVAQGKYFYTSSGVKTAGTASGGGSSWTKVAETTYTVNTSSTTAIDVATWETGHSELWTSEKIVYVRVRDTQGKRAGYFYGTDSFFINMHPANGDVNTSTGEVIMDVWSYKSGIASDYYAQRYGYNTTGYGVYAVTVSIDGNVAVKARYNSSYSLTIDSTYKVEIYLLDPPTGAPIFT